MQAFECAARLEFEDQMVVHAHKFSPRLHEVIGGPQMRRAVRLGIDAAFKYGFTRRGPVQFYVEMMLLFGSGVGSDPQYPWAVELLHAGSASDQMARADRLHAEASQYLENVHGPDNEYVYQALRRLSRCRATDLASDDIEGNLLAFLGAVHPEKRAHTGRDALESLIREAARKTREYTKAQDARDLVLITALMFSFGHDCDVDPLYPWIGRILAREPRAGSTGKTTVLERQSIRWMRVVLDNEAVQREEWDVPSD